MASSRYLDGTPCTDTDTDTACIGYAFTNMDSRKSNTPYYSDHSTRPVLYGTRAAHWPIHPQSITKTLNFDRPGILNPPASQESDSGNRSCESFLELKSRAGSTCIIDNPTWGYHTRTRMHATSIGNSWIFRIDVWSRLEFEKFGANGVHSPISFYVFVIVIYDILQSTSYTTHQ